MASQPDAFRTTARQTETVRKKGRERGETGTKHVHKFQQLQQSRLRATYANAKMPIEIKREANASTKPHKEEKPMQENRQETSRKKT